MAQGKSVPTGTTLNNTITTVLFFSAGAELGDGQTNGGREISLAPCLRMRTRNPEEYRKMNAPPMKDDNPPDVGAIDWRQSVAQSFRSEEVRSIAKVLASLEPGATSASKTMLAWRFEDSIFTSATDFDDYRKTIQKRLNKTKKKYKKQTEEAGGDRGVDLNPDLTRERELLLEGELRSKFGSRLLYIAQNGYAAVEGTRVKDGDRKADVLQQHVNNTIMWATQLRLQLPGVAGTDSIVRQERLDMEHLNKLKGYLESRVDSIRDHVVKITDPDLFLRDSFLKIQDTMLKDKVMEVLQKALKADPDSAEFSVEQMKRLVERMNASVPIPRRNQGGDILQAAMARIEKVRAASQALYTYLGLPLAGKTTFRSVAEKCLIVVSECLNELEGDYEILVKEVDGVDANGKRIILLEDAWNNPIQLTEVDSDEAHANEDAMGEEPDTKRQKTDTTTIGKTPLIIRSRFLLTSRRKTFATLLPALKRMGAMLVRNRSATFVRLEFGSAFEMTVYFEPLLVAIRAKDDSREVLLSSGGLCWPSLYQGLRPSDGGSRDGKGSSLSVLGVTGSYESLGPIIAKKLEYASAQATYVLRRCFSDTAAGKSSHSKSEYETEILEAGAFIRFLRIARATYSPDWVDVDP